MLRISSKTGGKLACRRDWLLHSLVVTRGARRGKALDEVGAAIPRDAVARNVANQP